MVSQVCRCNRETARPYSGKVHNYFYCEGDCLITDDILNCVHKFFLRVPVQPGDKIMLDILPATSNISQSLAVSSDQDIADSADIKGLTDICIYTARQK